MSDNRDRGLEFGALPADLEDEEYPLSHEALLEKYGDRELQHANGAVTVREAVGDEGQSAYAGADEVHETVLNMVGDEAVGRKDYTDRSQNARGEDYDEQSF